RAKNSGDYMAPVRAGLVKVCDAVARTFQAVEATIFLEDRLEAENVFNLFATTWPTWSQEKKRYLPRKDEGLTGWVLEERKPVRIFNLATFAEDRDNLRRSYPGIEWKDSLRIRQSASEILGLQKDALPPLSFMAAPILKGERVLGAIRCCTSRRAPWFFVERQLAVLTLVAAQISRFWSDWQQHQEEQEENQSWETLVTDISKLNHRVQDALARGALTEDDLYERTLRLAKRVIRGADILDIRLHDKQRGHLYFAKPKIGSAWTRGSKQEIEARAAKRFRVQQQPAEDDPLGVKVLFEGQARAVMNAEAEGYRSQTFPETKRIVVAPIGVQNKVVGVLDVRGTGSKPFTSHAPRMAEILGQQLGLYLSLWQSEQKQRKSEQQQRQVFEDLWHQIKSPVRQTFARAESLVQRVSTESWHPSDEEKADALERDLRMLRGVARKAKRVADSARLLADLARESELKLSPKTMSPLQQQETVRLLIEANIDTQHALEDKRDIKFRVVERSFDPLSRHTVKVDRDLVEQAVNCLLDNAGKYSFDETAVFVFCGEATREETRFVYLAVKNQGLAIAPDEVGLCKQRNWRGKWAQLTTGEGSGIGLWVVDHIMRAHGGLLEIIPTTDEGTNEVRLLFPVSA
ncbi:MAG TPA: GAF domain-containing protein, partial [Pyrinomonadaceae bacterium]